MSNIDKQALREKFEAWWEVNYHNGNPPRFGWEHWRDGDGYQVDDDESELDGMWESWQAAHSSKLEAAEKRVVELAGENEYIRKRFIESDLLFGKNLLVMQAAIIEWQGTGDARKGLAWIYNTLWGPGELPDESEKDAQAYFDRKYAPLDEELMALHRWFWEQSEAERAAAAGKGE